MKTPLNWISLFSDTNEILKNNNSTELAHIYSVHTAEIDDIFNYGQENKVVIGEVIDAKKHPNSDHLNIVQVNLGDLGKTQIVCGAENVIGAKYVPVATVGAVLKGDFEIKSARLRGEESNGMICSEDELDFQEDRAPGIMRLEDYFDVSILKNNIGKPFFDLEIDMPGINGDTFKQRLSDIVFEIDNKFITNRPDLFSIEGNAREFGAIFNQEFTPYSKKYEFSGTKLNTKINCDKVSAYNLVKIENINTKKSPFPIEYSLYKAGITPKFDMVDITNYIMTELGQPMHAFDADKIDGDIEVRYAKKGEKIKALNSETYELEDTDIVIADNSKVLAIGGIIGGEDSAISDNTKNIYLESACFDPVAIRVTAQRLGVRTDSSTRYEKSQDPLLTYRALARALDILDYLKKDYKIVGDSEYLNNSYLKNISVEFSKDFIDKKIGINIPEEEIIRILSQLGFDISGNNGNFKVLIPSWRVTKDISIKEDIAEEIGRIYSYDKVPEIPMVGDIVITKLNKNIHFKKIIIDYFSKKGFFEVYNYSFLNEDLISRANLDLDNSIKIINAYSNEFTHLRKSIAPGIFSNISENIKNQEKFCIFEIGKVSFKDGDSFIEQAKLAGACYNESFDKIKSALEGFLSNISSINNFDFVQGTQNINFMHPNKSGYIKFIEEEIGFYGYINPIVGSNFSIDDNKTIYFELDFEKISKIYYSNNLLFNDIPKYPSIDRELNFVMNEKTPVGDIIIKIKSLSELIRDIKIVDEYRSDEKIGAHKKSITFSINIQDYTKTITDEDAMSIQNKIINELKNQNIELRK